MFTKIPLSIVILFALISCSHHDQIKKDHLIAGKCEQLFNQTEVSQGQVIWQNVTETSGTGMSYLVTGLAYSTDFVVSFTSGVIGGMAICSPLLAIDALALSSSSSSSSAVSGNCIGEVGVKVAKEVNPNLGPSVKNRTKTWQCPDLDHIAEGLLKVADCYSASGETELAKKQLQKLNNSNTFQLCLSSNSKKKIESKLSKL